MSPQLFIFKDLVLVSKSGYSVNPSRGRIFFKMVVQQQSCGLDSHNLRCLNQEKIVQERKNLIICFCVTLTVTAKGLILEEELDVISPFHNHSKLFHNSQIVQVSFRFWQTNSVLTYCKVPKHFDYDCSL